MMADLAEMEPHEMDSAMKRLAESPRRKLTERLVRWKNLALVPAAAIAMPYLRLRQYKGLYLYCLARQRMPGGESFTADVRA